MAIQEEELGTEQADSFRPLGLRGGGVGRAADVGEHQHPGVVTKMCRSFWSSVEHGTTLFGAIAELGDGLLVGLDEHSARDPVEGQLGARLDLADPRAAHHGGDADLGGENCGVAGRATCSSDQAAYQLGIEGRGVGRGQILRHQDDGGVEGGNARFGQPLQDGQGPVAHIVQVGDPLGQVSASSSELGAEVVNGAPQGMGRAVALLEVGAHGTRQTGVTGHHGSGHEHPDGGWISFQGTCVEAVGNLAECSGHPRHVVVGVALGITCR